MSRSRNPQYPPDVEFSLNDFLQRYAYKVKDIAQEKSLGNNVLISFLIFLCKDDFAILRHYPDSESMQGEYLLSYFHQFIKDQDSKDRHFREKKFPHAFRESPDSFLVTYGRGIKENLQKDSEHLHTDVEPLELFIHFCIYLLKDNFKLLHEYDGTDQQDIYLSGLIHKFIQQLKKKKELPHEKRFPESFGESFDDFLKIYGEYIFTIMRELILDDSQFKIDDLFFSFLIYIAEDDYKRLRNYALANRQRFYLKILIQRFIRGVKNDEIEKFPPRFGNSVEAFLENYEGILYKIVRDLTAHDPVFKQDPSWREDCYLDFFRYISEDNFWRLWLFHGECEPRNYLALLLRNFFRDIKRSKWYLQQLKTDIIHDETIIPYDNDPERILIHKETYTINMEINKLIKEALEAALTLCKDIEKLSFALFYGYFGIEQGINARQINEILLLEKEKDVNTKHKKIYKINEKIKKYFIRELKKRGVGITKNQNMNKSFTMELNFKGYSIITWDFVKQV